MFFAFLRLVFQHFLYVGILSWTLHKRKILSTKASSMHKPCLQKALFLSQNQVVYVLHDMLQCQAELPIFMFR